jgi:hypothetical protein
MVRSAQADIYSTTDQILLLAFSSQFMISYHPQPKTETRVVVVVVECLITRFRTYPSITPQTIAPCVFILNHCSLTDFVKLTTYLILPADDIVTSNALQLQEHITKHNNNFKQ